MSSFGLPLIALFLSTPSARRATLRVRRRGRHGKISIHALREEGDRGGLALDPRDQISIHALREEGDLARAREVGVKTEISIHALREEGDR